MSIPSSIPNPIENIVDLRNNPDLREKINSTLEKGVKVRKETAKIAENSMMQPMVGLQFTDHQFIYISQTDFNVLKETLNSTTKKTQSSFAQTIPTQAPSAPVTVTPAALTIPQPATPTQAPSPPLRLISSHVAPIDQVDKKKAALTALKVNEATLSGWDKIGEFFSPVADFFALIWYSLLSLGGDSKYQKKVTEIEEKSKEQEKIETIRRQNAEKAKKGDVDFSRELGTECENQWKHIEFLMKDIRSRAIEKHQGIELTDSEKLAFENYMSNLRLLKTSTIGQLYNARHKTGSSKNQFLIFSLELALSEIKRVIHEVSIWTDRANNELNIQSVSSFEQLNQILSEVDFDKSTYNEFARLQDRFFLQFKPLEQELKTVDIQIKKLENKVANQPQNAIENIILGSAIKKLKVQKDQIKEQINTLLQPFKDVLIKGLVIHQNMPYLKDQAYMFTAKAKLSKETDVDKVISIERSDRNEIAKDLKTYKNLEFEIEKRGLNTHPMYQPILNRLIEKQLPKDKESIHKAERLADQINKESIEEEDVELTLNRGAQSIVYRKTERELIAEDLSFLPNLQQLDQLSIELDKNVGLLEKEIEHTVLQFMRGFPAKNRKLGDLSILDKVNKNVADFEKVYSQLKNNLPEAARIAIQEKFKELDKRTSESQDVISENGEVAEVFLFEMAGRLAIDRALKEWPDYREATVFLYNLEDALEKHYDVENVKEGIEKLKNLLPELEEIYNQAIIDAYIDAHGEAILLHQRTGKLQKEAEEFSLDWTSVNAEKIKEKITQYSNTGFADLTFSKKIASSPFLQRTEGMAFAGLTTFQQTVSDREFIQEYNKSIQKGLPLWTKLEGQAPYTFNTYQAGGSRPKGDGWKQISPLQATHAAYQLANRCINAKKFFPEEKGPQAEKLLKQLSQSATPCINKESRILEFVDSTKAADSKYEKVREDKLLEKIKNELDHLEKSKPPQTPGQAETRARILLGISLALRNIKIDDKEEKEINNRIMELSGKTTEIEENLKKKEKALTQEVSVFQNSPYFLDLYQISDWAGTLYTVFKPRETERFRLEPTKADVDNFLKMGFPFDQSQIMVERGDSRFLKLTEEVGKHEAENSILRAQYLAAYKRSQELLQDPKLSDADKIKIIERQNQIREFLFKPQNPYTGALLARDLGDFNTLIIDEANSQKALQLLSEILKSFEKEPEILNTTNPMTMINLTDQIATANGKIEKYLKNKRGSISIDNVTSQANWIEMQSLLEGLYQKIVYKHLEFRTLLFQIQTALETISGQIASTPGSNFRNQFEKIKNEWKTILAQYPHIDSDQINKQISGIEQQLKGESKEKSSAA